MSVVTSRTLICPPLRNCSQFLVPNLSFYNYEWIFKVEIKNNNNNLKNRNLKNVVIKAYKLTHVQAGRLTSYLTQG